MEETPITVGGQLAAEVKKTIRPTDNGPKPEDPINTPPQDPVPLELNADGIPVYYEGGIE